MTILRYSSDRARTKPRELTRRLPHTTTTAPLQHPTQLSEIKAPGATPGHLNKLRVIKTPHSNIHERPRLWQVKQSAQKGDFVFEAKRKSALEKGNAQGDPCCRLPNLHFVQRSQHLIKGKRGSTSACGHHTQASSSHHLPSRVQRGKKLNGHWIFSPPGRNIETPGQGEGFLLPLQGQLDIKEKKQI